MVEADVNESQVARLKSGTPAEIEIERFPDTRYRARGTHGGHPIARGLLQPDGGGGRQREPGSQAQVGYAGGDCARRLPRQALPRARDPMRASPRSRTSPA